MLSAGNLKSPIPSLDNDSDDDDAKPGHDETRVLLFINHLLRQLPACHFLLCCPFIVALAQKHTINSLWH